MITILLRNKTNKTNQIDLIKKQFLNDLIILCTNSRENRRTVLQMSVWQEFLIGLAHVYPQNAIEHEITDLVYDLFKILLHHAIKYEYGGWRVWIDTLSIFHSRVAKEDYQLKMKKLYEDYEKNKDIKENDETTNKEITEVEDEQKQADDQRTPFQLPPFRIPEFKWSHLHKRLLAAMLNSIDKEIDSWKSADGEVKTLIQAVNHPDNAIFCVNTIHIVSQLADILTNACGGLLPLLASATTVNSNEIEIQDNTEGMCSTEGYEFLGRIMNISDVIILGSNTSFADLEQEKNLPSGAIVRQTLRLTFTYAVRSCLEFKKINKIKPITESGNSFSTLAAKDPVEALLENQVKSEGAGMKKDCLLQDIDLFRLRALVYRDVVRNDRNKAKPFVVVDDVKQSQYISLATVYFISVLMVSRYRDIIETNSNTTNGAPASESSSDNVKTNGSNSNDTASTNGNYFSLFNTCYDKVE